MRALVLSGGGAKGAFEVGAIHAMVEQDIKEHRPSWDIILGISVGALNGALLAMYPKAQTWKAVAHLEELWGHIQGNYDIYEPWFLGRLASLWHSSVYDSSPLWRLVRRELKAEKVVASGRQLRVGAVSLTTGKLRWWTETSPDLVNGVLASSAFPGFFRPMNISGELWTDGGIREIAPFDEATQLGATSIDLVLASPVDSLSRMNGEPNTLEIAQRVVDIMSDEVFRGDLSRLDSVGIPVRVIAPKEQVLEASLNFAPQKIARNIELGKEAVQL